MTILFVDDTKLNTQAREIEHLAEDFSSVSLLKYHSGDNLVYDLEKGSVDIGCIDLAIIDYALPGKRNGREIGVRLKNIADDENANIRVAILTGKGDEYLSSSIYEDTPLESYISKDDVDKKYELIKRNVMVSYERNYFNRFNKVVVNEVFEMGISVVLNEISIDGVSFCADEFDIYNFSEREHVYLLSLAYAIEDGGYLENKPTNEYMVRAVNRHGYLEYDDKNRSIPEWLELETTSSGQTRHIIPNLNSVKHKINNKFKNSQAGTPLMKPLRHGTTGRISLSNTHMNEMEINYASRDERDPNV